MPLAEVHAKLSAAGLPVPTAIVETSPEHWHCYWRLEQPLPDLATHKRIQRALANVLGSFLLGVVGTRLATSNLRRPLLGTGVCGGLTTFSTVQVETLLMIQQQHYALAAGYTLAGICAGLLAVHLARGTVLG
jgi:fluoride ion exporter CrcB/FEX